MIKIIVITLLLIGCAQGTVTEIGPEFKPFVSDFEDLYGQSISGVIIEFSAINDDGNCSRLSNGQLVVKVNKAHWDSYCPGQKRGIVFHELGHCILGRGHTSNQMSYMYYQTRECEFYMDNVPELDRELFGP